MKKIIAAAFMCMLTGALFAGEVKVRPVISLGGAFGGDTLGEVPVTRTTYMYGRVTDTSDGTSEIKAGEGFYINAGAFIDFSAIPMELLVQVGWFYTSDNVDGWDASFIRYPVDLIAYYKITKNNRIGAGFTYHINNKYEDDFGWETSVEFKNALGEVIDYTYKLESFKIFLRYTFITYEADSVDIGRYSFHPDYEVEGNSFALGLSWTFGK